MYSLECYQAPLGFLKVKSKNKIKVFLMLKVMNHIARNLKILQLKVHNQLCLISYSVLQKKINQKNLRIFVKY